MSGTGDRMRKSVDTEEAAGAVAQRGARRVHAQAGFEDNRPEADGVRQLQAMADNAPQSTRHRALQNGIQAMSTQSSGQTLHNSPRMTAQRQAQAAINRTGLPDSLKAGVESLSGVSMDQVRVHYNSSRPAQLGAHAYAQGSDIHLATGQEHHLPHEAWHVVQQAQGRVRPTMQMKAGVPVNDDAGLEREADEMGAKALSALIDDSPRAATAHRSVAALHADVPTNGSVVQRVIKIAKDDYKTRNGKDTNSLVAKIEKDDRSEAWRRGWKTHVRDMAADKDDEYEYKDFGAFMETLDAEYLKESSDELARPSFPKKAYTLAKGTASVQSGKDMSDISLSDNDLALPHRMPFSDIRRSVLLFGNGTETSLDLVRWTDRLVKATEMRKLLNLKWDVKGLLPEGYEEMVDEQIEEFNEERDRVVKLWSAPKTKKDLSLLAPLLYKANSLHGNIPDLGSHSTNNVRVSNRIHSHFERGSMTPGTKAAYEMSPHRIAKGVATTKGNKEIVTVDDKRVPTREVRTHHEFSATHIPPSDLKPIKLNFSRVGKDDSDDESGSDSDDNPLAPLRDEEFDSDED